MSASFTFGTTDAAGQIDPSPSTYHIQWVGTLPVELIYFDAEPINGTQSLLRWATASELDNQTFIIERAPDALHWMPIGQVPGAGSSTEMHDYSMIDASPLSGINYYRLKQVDIDGNILYSDIVQVQFGEAACSAVLIAHPNPVGRSGQLYIDLNNTTDLITHISLSSAVGQMVYSRDISPAPICALSDLQAEPGIYLVTITTAAHKVMTSRIVIE